MWNGIAEAESGSEIRIWGSEHRDYKRIEAASGDESRDKLNKSNGGQI